MNCSLHLNVLLLNQIKTESEVVNMVDSDIISLQIKNLYQTIFAVPLAQGVIWASKKLPIIFLLKESAYNV